MLEPINYETDFKVKSFFLQVGLKSVVWKTASFLSSYSPRFFYNPPSYIINLLKINCGLNYK